MQEQEEHCSFLCDIAVYTIRIHGARFEENIGLLFSVSLLFFQWDANFKLQVIGKTTGIKIVINFTDKRKTIMSFMCGIKTIKRRTVCFLFRAFITRPWLQDMF